LPRPGFEKVAIFADELGEPRHAARQLGSGEWTSKLGDHVDIEHEDLDVVGGHLYGEPRMYLRRRVSEGRSRAGNLVTD
jgi:hypothetical protein